jgi:hypothetical protein
MTRDVIECWSIRPQCHTIDHASVCGMVICMWVPAKESNSIRSHKFDSKGFASLDMASAMCEAMCVKLLVEYILLLHCTKVLDTK